MDMKKLGYVVVTDYVEANTGKDVADAIQQLIADNPNKTLYFPDGEYVLSKPICTPAEPTLSVSLSLSNYAVLKASEDWSEKEAVVRLGAIHSANNITTNGSNYYFEGGIIDGGDKANGISVDGGRETRIENVSIKNTVVGVHIKRGVNSGSSDADVLNVNIVGSGTPESIGVLIEGCDNTFTNMRIASVQVGVKVYSSPNFFRNLHPLYIYEKALEGTYADSVGFLDLSIGNWYDICYSDQFATGFSFGPRSVSYASGCFCYWYTDKGGTQTSFRATEKFNAIIKNSRVNFKHPTVKSAYLAVGEAGGKGVVENPILKDECCDDKTYLDYLKGEVVPIQ